MWLVYNRLFRTRHWVSLEEHTFSWNTLYFIFMLMKSPFFDKINMVYLVIVCFVPFLIFVTLLNRFGPKPKFWGWSIHWVLKVSSILESPRIYKIYHVSIVFLLVHWCGEKGLCYVLVMLCSNGLLSDLIAQFWWMLGILTASIFSSFFRMQIFAMQWHILSIR